MEPTAMNKKNKKPIVAAPKQPSKMIVDQVRLLKLLRADAERRAAGNTHVIATERKRQVLAQIDPQGHVLAAEKEIRDAGAKMEQYAQVCQELLKSIQDEFGIDINQYELDDQTGELKKLKPPEVPAK